MKGYPFSQFAVVVHRARFNQRSVGRLGGPKKRAEAGICRRKLITRRAMVLGNPKDTNKRRRPSGPRRSLSSHRSSSGLWPGDWWLPLACCQGSILWGVTSRGASARTRSVETASAEWATRCRGWEEEHCPSCLSQAFPRDCSNGGCVPTPEILRPT